MKNEALDKAIIGYSGVWPCEDGEILCCAQSLKRIANKDQFTLRAKDLGFINGYRWGVEYTTYGKRPDLDGDIVVYGRNYGDECGKGDKVKNFFWNDYFKFKVVDDRYKPADTSYLNALTQSQILTHSEEGLTHSDWWDYENDKAITECPADSEVEVTEEDWAPLSEFGKSFLGQKCVVKSTFKNRHGFDMVSVEKPDGECCCFVFRLIRPLGHATRKAELEKKRVVDAVYELVGGIVDLQPTLEALYDSGYLRLPEQAK